jgi:8-oxo-dGTP pyrophosphatase MutT (NUDIX family)
MKARKAAAREALEEAGIKGKTSKRPLGEFFYEKAQADRRITCKVTVYALSVENQLAEWDEKGERALRWCSPGIAAQLVSDPGLAGLISKHFLRH